MRLARAGAADQDDVMRIPQELASVELTRERLVDLAAVEVTEAMPKKKSPVRNPWTKEDLRQLKAHSKTRTPVVEVAKAMKRTEAAVRQKAKTIGVGLGHRR